MTLIYLDCFSGVSGDMLIGALLDIGAPFDKFTTLINTLGLPVQLAMEREVVNGVSCCRFMVKPDNNQPLRHLSDILNIINHSRLGENIKASSIAVFQQLAEAEASVHGVDINQVHFHEIGAVDTIIDIVGTFVCLELLNIDTVISSSLPWSNGYINISHGKFPVPAPATALLLRDIPCCGTDVSMELVTPTGAALLKTICSQFGVLPACTPHKIGYGAGSNVRNDGVPNLLRVILADQFLPGEKFGPESAVAIIETEVDDLNPEVFSHLYEILFADTEVLDFYTSSIIMKKNRPGFLLTLLCRPDSLTRLARILLDQTGTLGVRYRYESRFTLKRHLRTIQTPWGAVRIKSAELPGGGYRTKPEYEDCHAIALKHQIPLIEVMKMVNGLIEEPTN